MRLLLERIDTIHELDILCLKAVGIKVLSFPCHLNCFLSGKVKPNISKTYPNGWLRKMEGEEESSDDPRAFSNQPVGKRALVIGAGPALNIIFAFIMIFIVMTQSGLITNKITSLADNSPQQIEWKRGQDYIL